jgi:DNA-binding MarR family transcriptional regulator
MRLAALTGEALAPFGIDGRECAVLLAIDDRVPVSQHEVARRMGVDRTSMVMLIDELEGKGLVHRRQDPADRRRNVVELTGEGKKILARAVRASDKAERAFLAPLSTDEAAAFRQALRSVTFA